MATKRKESQKFRECVDSRYQHDLIMNGPATIMILLVPLIVLAVVSTLSETSGKYAILSDFVPSYTLVCVVFELFCLMLVVYSLYSRLYKHSLRDREWRLALIGYASSKKASTKKMGACHKMALLDERFPGMVFARLLLVLMLALAVWIMLYVVPVLPPEFENAPYYHFIVFGTEITKVNVYYLSIACSVLLFLALVMMSFIKLLSFTYRHEQRQAEFTRYLRESLAEVKIDILSMTPVVKKSNFFLNVFLFAVTGGFYFFILVFRIFRKMNDHLMNNWVYEGELLRAVESDGRFGFDSLFYNRSPERNSRGKIRKRKQKKFSNMMRFKVRNDNSMPPFLVVAEIFLIIVCASYIFKIISLGYDMSLNYADYYLTWSTLRTLESSALTKIGLVVIDTAFLMTTIISILGLASRRAASWRKVVRSCITFVFPLWITAFVTHDDGLVHLFDFNVYITTVILAAILAVMLVSEKIHRFYAPVGHDIPPVSRWIRYAFWGKLVGIGAATVIIAGTVAELDGENLGISDTENLIGKK